jgi:CheY-like chemotaxis protein
MANVLGRSFPGAEVECAADGRTALAAFDRVRPSVVVTDLNMPGLDGMQLTGLLRKRDPGSAIPIIVLHRVGWTAGAAESFGGGRG